MPKIPFTMRRSGRYYFRKRARWQNGNDVTAIVSLETCCAQEARIRGAALSAHFEKVKQAVSAYFNLDRTLEPEMLKGLFETELRTCLAQLIDKFHDPATDPQSLVRLARTHASAFDLAQRPGTIVELTDEHRRKLAAAGHDEWAIEEVACELDQYCNRDLIADDIMEIMAESLGVEPTPAVIGRLKHIHLLAMAEANRLAAHFLDEDVQSAFDQQEALLAKRRKNGEPLSFPHASTKATSTMQKGSRNWPRLPGTSADIDGQPVARATEVVRPALGTARTPGRSAERLAALYAQRPYLKALFAPLIASMEAVEEQLRASNRLLNGRAKADEVCSRLMRVPRGRTDHSA